MANLNDLDLKICATEGDIPSEAPEKDQIILVGGESDGVPIGGTSGQILAKQSAADFDTEWIDPPSGGGTEIIGGYLNVVVGDWSGSPPVATKTITGLTDNDIVKVAPATKTDAANWATANIWVTQSGTTLTFSADTAPTASIAVVYEITKGVLS